MYQIIYASKAENISFEDVNMILTISSNNNKLRNISGALIYVQGYFLQSIAGDKSVIEYTYENIKKDIRHDEMISISSEEVEEVNFDGWYMSYVNAEAYKQIIEPIVKTMEFNPYFLDHMTALKILKQVSKQL